MALNLTSQPVPQGDPVDHGDSSFGAHVGEVDENPMEDQLPTESDGLQNLPIPPTNHLRGSLTNSDTRITYEDSITINDSIDEGENSFAYAATINKAPEGVERTPFFVGNQTGQGFVISICHDGHCSPTSHFLIPRAARRTLSEEDLRYLTAKGAFKFPSRPVISSIFRHYFHYVHPTMPIINPETFLLSYNKTEVQDMSALLLWSMMFATACYLDTSTLAQAGFDSRKEMKRATYDIARALYHTDHEPDKVILIQSVMLIGVWNSDADDRMGPWHWNGVAISLAHSMGMHSAIQDERTRDDPAYNRFRLWHLIWWSCYSREVWLSVTLGRPLRMDLKDCTTPLPSASDAEVCMSGSQELLQNYVPDCLPSLLCIWIKQVKLSKHLGRILSRSDGPMELRQLLETEAEIRESCMSSLQTILGKSASTPFLLHQYQLELNCEATVIALYRPEVIRSAGTEQSAMSSDVPLQRACAAASNSVAILNKLISLDLVSLFHSNTVSALLPVMQVHLVELTSPNKMRQRVAQHQLDICMIALCELQKTYWGAGFAVKFFGAAQRKLNVKRQAASRPASRSSLLPQEDAENADTGNGQSDRSNTIRAFETADTGSNSWFSSCPAEMGLFSDINQIFDINSLLGEYEFNGCLDFNPG